MAEVAFNVPSPYQQEQASIQRRRAMADALERQSYQPIEQFSYAGIPAPISPAAGLAKMLESAMPALERRSLDREEKTLVEGARKKGEDWLTELGNDQVAVPPLAEGVAGPPAPPRPRSGAERQAMLLSGVQLDNPRIAGIASSLYAKDIAPPEFKEVDKYKTPGFVKGGVWTPTPGFTPKTEPQDAVAKVQADFQSGLIDQATRDARITKLNSFAPSAQVPAAPTGWPYQGMSIEAQDSNILHNGDPNSAVYRGAYNRQAEPKTFIDQSSGQVVTRTPDMTAYRKPGDGAAPDAAMGPPGSLSAKPTPGAKPGTAADRSKLKSIESEVETLLDSLDNFLVTVNAANTKDFLSALGGGPTAGGRKLNSAWTNTSLIAKGEALFNLGVLNGPDLTIIRNTLPDPSTPSGAIASKQAYAAAVSEISRLVNSRLRAFRRQYGSGDETPPKATRPEWMDPKVWKQMTPEEQKLFGGGQ